MLRCLIAVSLVTVAIQILQAGPAFAQVDAGVDAARGASAPRIRDSATLRRIFANPPREYSTAPLWVWNDDMTDEMIVDSLRDLAAHNIRQAFVHPRPGLMTPYLSDDWFRLWRVALEEARKLDMNLWIYDENSYPSGFAGGHVPRSMPEARGRGLTPSEKKGPVAPDPAIVGAWLQNTDSLENVTAKLRSGEALPARGEGESPYLVFAVERDGDSPWHGGGPYVDLLYPGVTQKFIEVTLEPYRRNFGGEFGKRIPGTFTDEPQIRPVGRFPWTDDLPAVFQKRWGYAILDNLPSLIRKTGDWRRVRHNYCQTLLDLFIERWAKPMYEYCEQHNLEFTGHYWEHEWANHLLVPDNMAMYAWHQRPAIDTLFNQYSEGVHAQFGNVRAVKELSSVANQLGRRTLCEAYGGSGWDVRLEDLKRIGDWLCVLGVNTIDQHLTHASIRGARKRDYPQTFSYHEPWWRAYGEQALYFARLSAALSAGEEVDRILVLEPTTTLWMYVTEGDRQNEEIAAAFQQLITELAKQQVEYDLGSESIIGRHGSIDRTQFRVGRRAYDVVVIPPGLANMNGRVVELLGQYLDAGGLLICGGKGPTLVDGQPSPRLAEVKQKSGWQADAELPTLAQRLLETVDDRWRLDADPGGAGILFHVRRRLADGELVFVANTSVDRSAGAFVRGTARAVEEWDLRTGECRPYEALQTGRLVVPRIVLPPSGSILLFLPVAPAGAKKAGGEDQQQDSDELEGDGAEALGDQTAIAAIATPQVKRGQPNVVTLDFVDVTAPLSEPRAQARGQARGQEPGRAKDGEPVGDASAPAGPVAGAPGSDTRETRTGLYVCQANNFIWQKHGLKSNPWEGAVQYKDELIRKTFPPDSGFEATYHFTVEGTVPADLCAVVERGDLYTITCNGEPVRPAEPGSAVGEPTSGRSVTDQRSVPQDWWLDRAFKRIDISKAARVGENTLTIMAAPMTMLHELEAAYILGDFSLRPAERGFVIVPPQPLKLGKWNEQGVPLYGHEVAYTQEYDVPPAVSGTSRPGTTGGETAGRDAGPTPAPAAGPTLTPTAGRDAGRYVVELPKWYGSVAEVRVNGESAGYIWSQPYECDVTKLIKPGQRNTVEVIVIGTLKNTLGPHHGDPPLGIAGPWLFHKAPAAAKDAQGKDAQGQESAGGPPAGPPPGAQYSTVGYGLFEPFVLKRSE
ncbi:MAG: glycosyl hydrolase [Planctomycetota bacterium]